MAGLDNMLPCLRQLCCSWSQGAVPVQDAGDPDRQGSVCQQPGQSAQPLCCDVILEDIPLVCQLLLQLILPLPAASIASDITVLSSNALPACRCRLPYMIELDEYAAFFMRYAVGGLL